MSSKKDKRKRSSGSGGGSKGSSGHIEKRQSVGPAGGVNKSTVSETLHEVNQILYRLEPADLDDSVFEKSNNSTLIDLTKMAAPRNVTEEPTMRDVMTCLQNIEKRVIGVEKRMDTLDELNTKITNFEVELKKVWIVMDKSNKVVTERVSTMEDKVHSNDFMLGQVQDRVVDLERQREELRSDLVYMQAESMRNNFMFSNISDELVEGQDDCEKKVRQFLVSKMKLAQDMVADMKFERVHRMGQKQNGRIRNIVAKFHEFKDKELVRRNGRALQGTHYSVYEQFPSDIVVKRKRLLPKMKAARDQGKKAWIAYDTLYVDGRAVRE